MIYFITRKKEEYSKLIDTSLFDNITILDEKEGKQKYYDISLHHKNAYVDIEATGLDPYKAELILLGIMFKSRYTKHYFMFDWTCTITDIVEDLSWQDFKIKMSTLTNDKVVFLVDELYEYEGITFYGTPWIAPIHWQTWAFEDIQNEYDEYICPYEKIQNCDILITHENPNYNEKLEHYCFGKYKHHFFGHWHDGISYGHLNQYNCSILTDSYLERERPKIVTIELSKNDN